MITFLYVYVFSELVPYLLEVKEMANFEMKIYFIVGLIYAIYCDHKIITSKKEDS